MSFNKFIKFNIAILLFFLCAFLIVNYAFALGEDGAPTNKTAPTNAASTNTGLEQAANIAGLGKPSLPSLIGRFVQGTLSFVGVIFLILMVYGGFLWMTAGGNEEHVTKAKKLIMSATIGLFIVIGAYAITYYLTSVLLEAAKVE